MVRACRARPCHFGYGSAWSIAGSSADVAIATAIGDDLVFDSSLSSLQETLDYPAGKLALSSKRECPGCAREWKRCPECGNRTLNFYSLPSETFISSYPSTDPGLTDFTLSASGTTISQAANNGYGLPTRNVSVITGGPGIWSDTGNSGPILLSPDGTLIAEYAGSNLATAATNIIQNGTLITAVPALLPAGSITIAYWWIPTPRFPCRQARNTPALPSTAPQVLRSSTPPLPALNSIQTVTSDTVYDPASNSIYSLTTGQSVWTGSHSQLLVPVPWPVRTLFISRGTSWSQSRIEHQLLDSRILSDRSGL